MYIAQPRIGAVALGFSVQGLSERIECRCGAVCLGPI